MTKLLFQRPSGREMGRGNDPVVALKAARPTGYFPSPCGRELPGSTYLTTPFIQV
ncbi:MAG TPA: hypothetical protein PLL06_13430 [Acidobacteriota bacterium]|nr:hypothetical protein [Acidobacteriota bacterium]